MDSWLRTAPIWVLGLGLLVATIASAIGGWRFNGWLTSREGKLSEAQEGYVVTSVYGLLGLLVAFTFQLAVDRYQVRRQLVVDDANAVEALYLKAQLLGQPHRSVFSNLLVRYTQNHIALAEARQDEPNAQRLIAEDRVLQGQLWAATLPAFQTLKPFDISSSFVESVVELSRVDATRHAARSPAVPTTIVVMLLFYSLIAAVVLGTVMKGLKGLQVSVLLIVLNVLALMLVMDLNRPVQGTIRESQAPMKRTLLRLQATAPAISEGPAH